MKTCILFIALAFSIRSFGQQVILGKIYSIVTGRPLSNISLRLDKKQSIQADTNGVFEIRTVKRKFRISVFSKNTYYLDTLLFVNAITDSIKLFISYPIDSTLANYDIDNYRVQLFYGGGIAPLAPMPSDKIFERKYSVKYHRLDCLMPEISGLNSYNKRVALYLDRKYGADWRQAVRPDIFGVNR